jgi:hypothetical protein
MVLIHITPEKMLDEIGFDEVDEKEIPWVSVHEIAACSISDIKALHEGGKIILFLPHCKNLPGENGISASNMVFNFLP